MSLINIKMLTDESYQFMSKNIETVVKNIVENENNDWIYNEFPKPMFVEKTLKIEDFSLIDNPDSKDKDIDFKNSVIIFENLKTLPRYILCDDKFWLWLYLEKFYSITKNMMRINGVSTVKDHWMNSQGVRRGNFFGVLSRCYYRVLLSIDEKSDDKYCLTKWVIENPERLRNLTWRTFSSQVHLVRGCLKGQKKAVDELGYEVNSIYPEVAKYVSILGSVHLLDVLSEEYIQDKVYNKVVELLKEAKGDVNETIC